jgi:hypothetical protein
MPEVCGNGCHSRADHFGGSRETDDFAVFKRLTGATMATHLTLVKSGDVVIGVSATHSHPSVGRAAGYVGARFIDTAGLAACFPMQSAIRLQADRFGRNTHGRAQLRRLEAPSPQPHRPH